MVNSDYNCSSAPTTVTIGSHSLTGTNPLFVNLAGNDYHLLVGSPAAGAGLNLGVATTSTAIAPCSATIGAYELASFLITPYADVGGVITPGTPQTVDYDGASRSPSRRRRAIISWTWRGWRLGRCDDDVHLQQRHGQSTPLAASALTSTR